MTIRSVAWLIPCALLAVGACTPSSSNPGIPNEVPDAAIDAAIDAAPDGAIDAPPDAPPAPGVLVASAAVVDLGISQPGFFITAPFGITNTGATPVGLGTLILSPPFEIFFSNCQGTLAPGASCLVEVSFTPTAIGLTTGTASLRSSANTVSVALEARGGFGLDVGGVIEGASVTSDPAGLGPTPGGDLQGVFATAVTLTAIPPPGGAFLGWDPVCGDNGPTCVVPVPDDRNFLLIRARFQAAPPVGPKVTVTFAGGSTGQVRMFDDTSDAPITTCVASPCVGVVPEGHHVTLFGFSSSQFGGWTGDCVSTTHDCDLGTVTSDRAAVVTFNRDPGEVVSFVTDDVPHWVAFAPDGGLYVSYLEVRKLRLDGTIEWRFPKVGVHDMASDAAGNLYAVSGRELFSLSPDGALRWSTTVDLAPNFLRSIESGVQVSSDGTIIAVHTADGARVLDGNGNDRFALTGLTGIDGFALA
ncbi:MAG TPA: hypothetical protein VFP84_18570, partial [Kofleriaceae bacterium]|nr:hypothetical protein [Kofleriaceae bacterium]